MVEATSTGDWTAKTRVQEVGRPLVYGIVAAAMFFAPFNGGFSLPHVGEIGSDPFFTIPLLTVPIVMLEIQAGRYTLRNSYIKILALGLLAVMVVGLVTNIIDIVSARLRDRQGPEKFVTSAMVVFLGVYVASLLSLVGQTRFSKNIARPILYSSLAVIVVGVIELGAQHSGAMAAIYRPLFKIAHYSTHTGESDGVGGRIQSVTFEPSFFGAYISFVMPWLLVGIVYGKTKLTRHGLVVFLLSGMVLAMFSGRTSQAGVPLTLGLFVFCAFAVRSRPEMLSIYKLGAAAIFLLVTLSPLYLMLFEGPTFVNALLATYNSSNVSRFGTAYILAQLFWEHPLFGIGMGQYGFYVPSHVPGWAYNWEFKRWMVGTGASFYPSFSVIARIAGELGGIGLVFWCGFFIVLIRRVIDRARIVFAETRRMPIVGAAIATNLFGSSLYGWSAGSFRALAIWGAIGMAIAYIWNSVAIEMDVRTGSRGPLTVAEPAVLRRAA